MEKKEEQPMYSRMMEAFHRIRKVNISTMMEVSQIEFFALQIIYKYQEEHLDREGIYVSDLAEKLKIASSQTSRMLRNLEERQWISRSIDTKDRRN
ncbi:MAG: MarR family transcriptional regulator, partial [Lachnospiraceae bacterium]